MYLVPNRFGGDLEKRGYSPINPDKQGIFNDHKNRGVSRFQSSRLRRSSDYENIYY